MISLNTVFLAVFSMGSAILPSRCNEHHAESKKDTNTLISKISYNTTGGRSGNYESLDISADSVTYMQARRGDEKFIKEKTAKDFWNKITGTINLKDFDQIETNPGHALYDGIDITLSIETPTRKHSVVNGHEDSVNYRRISPFTNLLEETLVDFRKKITW